MLDLLLNSIIPPEMRPFFMLFGMFLCLLLALLVYLELKRHE